MTTKVLMRQTGKYTWEIVSDKGVKLQENISLGSLYQAHEYINRWVSSYHGWDYEVVPLDKNSEVKYKKE